MSGALIEWVLSHCECCDDGCDCGCVTVCPRHAENHTNRSEGAES